MREEHHRDLAPSLNGVSERLWNFATFMASFAFAFAFFLLFGDRFLTAHELRVCYLSHTPPGPLPPLLTALPAGCLTIPSPKLEEAWGEWEAKTKRAQIKTEMGKYVCEKKAKSFNCV